MIDETNKAIVDFSKAVTLQPNFPVAHVQKLYTDYRAATTIGDSLHYVNIGIILFYRRSFYH